jgi:DNA-binding HxlR family transcriptional regulator
MVASIYTGSVRDILSLMEQSTGHLYYVSELQDVTGLSKRTVINTLNTLAERGVVRKEQEPLPWHSTRAARTYVELTPLGLSALRLFPPST